MLSPEPLLLPQAVEVLTDANIYAARDAWLANPASARQTYGDVSNWDVSRITDMSFLFCATIVLPSHAASSCNAAGSSFNDDLSHWDVSSVTNMEGEHCPVRAVPTVQSSHMLSCALAAVPSCK